MELFDLERKIKNNIEGSKIKQNLLEGFLNELQGWEVFVHGGCWKRDWTIKKVE